MAATILIWRSHGNRGGFSSKINNAGHASLVLSYKSPTNEGVKQQFATMTWFPEQPDGAGKSGNVCGGIMSYGRGPESSGRSAGHVPRSNRDMFQYSAIREMRNIYTNHRNRNELEDLQGREHIPDYIGPPHALTTEQRQRLAILKGRYPTLGLLEEQEKQKNSNGSVERSQWVLSALEAYKNQAGVTAYNDLLQTRVRPPDATAEIPTTCDDNVLIGLNDIAMMLWWRQYSDQKKTYNLLSRNCSTICGNALVAGGGTGFVKCPVSRVWTPEAVYNWAVKLGEMIRRKNQEFLNSKARIRSDPSNANGGTIWSVKQWKQESNLTMKRRYWDLQEVDYLLHTYHTKTTVPFHSRATRRVELRTVLATIVLLLNKIISDHDRNGRASRRHEAIIGLGRQCLDEIKELYREEQRDFQAARAEANVKFLTDWYFRALYQLQSEEFFDEEIRSIREVQSALHSHAGLGELKHNYVENLIRRMQHVQDMLKGEPAYVPNPNF